MSLKKLTALALLAQFFLPSMAEEKVNIDYMPEFHGVVRARYEMDMNNDQSRFQVRNARLAVDGRIAPPISYFIQVDFCDQGKFLFLDAWGKFNFSERMFLQAGQFRIPFGVDPFMAPTNYIFNNRSFIGKQVCNYRGTGAKLSYAVPAVPLTLEAGAFNSATMDDHTVWSKHLSYAVKGVLNMGNTTVTGGFESIAPYAVRMNSADVALSWKSGRLWLLGEYMFKHYCSIPRLSDTHSWVAFADYYFPVKWGMFNRASVQGRYDGMTDNSNGKLNQNGKVTYNNAAANRITLGGTVTYTYKKVHADVRLNYEKYFYRSATQYPRGFDNLLSAELVVRF